MWEDKYGEMINEGTPALRRPGTARTVELELVFARPFANGVD